MKHFEEVTYFRETEEEDGEVYGVGDSYHVTIYDKDTDEIVVTFGDYYHGKGEYKLAGFYAGLKYAGVEFDVTCRDDKV